MKIRIITPIITKAVLADSDCWVISDDVYEFIRYDGARPAHILALQPALRERGVVVNSVSKTYAMTGWRIGYAAGPAALIKGMGTIQGQSTSNPSSIAQAAAAAALEGAQDELGTMVDFVMELGRGLQDGTLKIPPPPDRIAGLPVVGEQIHATWELATRNLAAALCELAPENYLFFGLPAPGLLPESARVVPVDLFPQTSHLELVASMRPRPRR